MTARAGWLMAMVATWALTTPRAEVARFDQNDPQIVALLEPIRVKHHLPALGGAIVTSQGVRALGVTGLRKVGGDVAATADDLWHLGSDTKAMTAVVIAKLVEQGKLTWDTTIEAVLPKPVANARPEFNGITLLQLLSHRAGLVANLNWPELARTPGQPRAQRLAALRTAASTPLSSPPGTRYQVLQPRLRDRRDDGRDCRGPRLGRHDPRGGVRAARHEISRVRRDGHARTD